MSEASPTLVIRKRRVTAYRGRGGIYNWLRAHRDPVASKLESGEATWPALCAEMIRHGVTGRGGEVPTPKAAAKVWHRVCRDTAAIPPAAPKRLLPSRLPKEWRPEVVPATVPASPPATALAPYVPAFPTQALTPALSGGGKGRVIDEAGRARGLAEIARAMRALENIDISTFGPGVNVGPPPIRAVSGDNPVRDASGEPEDA